MGACRRLVKLLLRAEDACRGTVAGAIAGEAFVLLGEPRLVNYGHAGSDPVEVAYYAHTLELRGIECPEAAERVELLLRQYCGGLGGARWP